mgnify:CR=1 FL=1
MTDKVTHKRSNHSAAKKRYLKLIPYTWSLINMRINNNKTFNDLKELLNKNFKKKLK